MADYTEKRGKGLSSFALRIIGCAAMLWASIYESFGHGSVDWGTYMLWFSFTIFAFLLVEGFINTIDKKLYFLRLLLFTVISEPCFNLFFSGKLWDPYHQSIMVTLLIGYIVMVIAEQVRKKFDNMILTLICVIVLGIVATTGAMFLNGDLGQYGIMVICMIYICSHVTYTRLLELILFVLFTLYTVATNYFNIMIDDLYYSVPDKAFALLAIIVTFFYSGKRGPNSIALKWAFYAFFPVMLLLIWFIRTSITG